MLRPDPEDLEDHQRVALVAKIGLDWKTFMGSAAQENLSEQLHVMKDEMHRRLVSAEDDPEFARAAVMIIDSLLSLPNEMIQQGAEAEQVMHEMLEDRL